MNYISNIYLNFNKEYFDFYEWNDNDKVLHINKIPIIKVNTNTFNEIINNNIKLNSNIFNNKTIIDNNKYTCLLISDNRHVIGLKFINNISTMISSITIDDEYNILNKIKNINNYNLNYTILNKRNYILDTRLIYIHKKYILDNIKNIPYDTLKYIYYDCFNIEEDKYNIMLNKLIDNINNNNYICNKIYDILKPISL